MSDESSSEAGGDATEDASGQATDSGPTNSPVPTNGPAQTTPRVDLALHGLTVSVTGRSEDELDTVADSARDLMDYLVDKNEELEDDHDEYGLS